MWQSEWVLGISSLSLLFLVLIRNIGIVLLLR
jgi:hypothetical protein